MKELHSHSRSKAWASLDCLATTNLNTPLSRSLLTMRSNGVLQVTDIRRLSPQTTSSSGYQSDLSSANGSPKSIRENLPSTHESFPSAQVRKKRNDHQSIKTKNRSSITTFILKQYERAKSKFLSPKPLSPSIATCSKATSTTPIPYPVDQYATKSQQSLFSTHHRSSFIEPVRSIYVQPIYDNQPSNFSKNYDTIDHYRSRQPSHQFLSYPKANSNSIDSHPSRRLATISNYENITTGCLATHSNPRRQHFHSKKAPLPQSYYPYRYIEKNYDYNRSAYAPLSDLLSDKKQSAFKPVKLHRRSLCPTTNPMPPSEDPCDLEVAQYFRQTPQRSNPTYFNIYAEAVPAISARKNFTETLC